MKQNKSLFLLIVIGMLCSGSFSQDDGAINNRNNEFSISIDDIFAKNPIAILPYFYIEGQAIIPYYNNAFDSEITTIGLGYKHYFGESGIRSKISFGSKSEKVEYACCNNEDRFNFLSAKFSIGYEWLSKIRRLHIFYGADVFINHNKTENESIQNEGDYRKTELIYDETAYGINPVLGAKFFVTEGLSLSTEIKYFVELFNGEVTLKDTDALEDTVTKTSGRKLKFGPLGQLSVNIHF